MLLRILGGMDLVIALIIILLGVGVIIPNQIIFIIAILLLIKSGFGFFKDIGSVIDVVSALILLFSTIIYIPGLLIIICGLVLAQKGIFSFF